jgi:hypothetical protein
MTTILHCSIIIPLLYLLILMPDMNPFAVGTIALTSTLMAC